MNELLEKFLKEKYIFQYIKIFFTLDENNNLLFQNNISKANNEWILFCRKEKLKILKDLENE